MRLFLPAARRRFLRAPGSSTEPPAFSTAATADFEAPQTENATLALNSPPPSSRTPSLARRSSPALTSAATSTGRAGVEHAGVDRRLHPAEIDLVELERERRVAEAALGQAAMQRHLAAFEALDAHARARGLALAAAAAGLALAGADAAADAHALLARARLVGDLVEFHRTSSYFARRPRARVLHLAIMPRVAGVSGRSLTRPILLSPSPTSVSRWA